MKKCSLLYFILIAFLFQPAISAQQLKFEDLLMQKENDPSSYFAARQEAVRQNLPVSINIPGLLLSDVIAVTNGVLYYSVITNFANPFDGGSILSSDEVKESIDFNKARLTYGDGKIVDNSDQPIVEKGYSSSTRLLLIPDWTNDNVHAFDPYSGDLVSENFIAPDPTHLASPKQALLNPLGFISVSDQITDIVVKYDTSGVFSQIYAPAGGPNTSILDNIRGHAYHPTNGDLLVAVGSSANQNAITRFDKDGVYLGNFIPAGTIVSPFGILVRQNDILVSGSTSDAVLKYDFSGNLLGTFCSGIQFPQQVSAFPGNDVAVAVFSIPSGLAIYDSAGTQLSFLTAVTGIRGSYPLGSGSYMVTNGGGVHEINRETGALIRTIYAATNCQFVDLADYSVIPVELTSFTANVSGRTVVLNWSTATEINNRGFEVQRSMDNSSFENVAFVNGAGTSAEKHNYSFSDQPDVNGIAYYRLKQLDYDGSFEYSNVIEADLSIPLQFAVEQNYPNPFNPVTNIKFSIPSDELVKVEVFNAIGESVSVVQNGTLKAGIHSVSFNASGLNSGVYYYKVTAGNHTSVKKMVLMK